jgi:hypothetical protein
MNIDTFNALTVSSEFAVRGTCGFFANPGNNEVSRGMVTHVLADGRLIVKTDANSDSHIIIPRELFKPSRDAYFSFGSYAEPEWEEDSCRCTNVWATEFGNPNVNQATNIRTDGDALRIHGFDPVDFAYAMEG